MGRDSEDVFEGISSKLGADVGRAFDWWDMWINARVGPTLNLLFPQYCGSLTGHETHLQAVGALRRRDGDALARAIREDLNEGAQFLIRLLKP